ncbi:MAG: GntR family transcriptional regulator [Turicibacter sp.]|nr:GntR family transcriptional regulator [Turicibacter sp.]
MLLKYQEIAESIENHIRDNALKQGDKLPSLEQLVTEYKVSKSTIRKALELLESKGAVYQLRGSGIFVRSLKRPGYIDLGFSRGFKKDLGEFEMTTEVLAVEVRAASAEVAANLNIETGDAIYYIKRLRFIYGKPLCIEESHYDKSVVPYMNKEIVKDSIFYYLRNGLKLSLGFSDTYFNIGKINEAESKLLKLEVGEPALRLENIFFLATGQAFNYSKTTYNYEESQFFIQATSTD